MEQANLDYWKTVDKFTLLQVGYLWVNLEPPPDEENPNAKKYSYQIGRNSITGDNRRLNNPSTWLQPKILPASVKLIFEMLIDAVNAETLPAKLKNISEYILSKENISGTEINNYSLIELTRNDLQTYAGSINAKPPFLHSDSATDLRQRGQSKAIRESKENTVKAAYLVGKMIGESELLPVQITKKVVQDFLGKNNFGFGDSKLFQSVWKSMPETDKNRSGRPLNK